MSTAVSSTLIGLALAVCGIVVAQPTGAADSARPGATVPIYPGAALDATATKFVKESMKLDGKAYRTADSLKKVVEFYRKQPGIRPIGAATPEAAGFGLDCQDSTNEFLKSMGLATCKIEVSIQSPYMDMSTGALKKDTLISIVNKAANANAQ